MAVVVTHPEHIEGPWIEGFVLDRHVLSSVPIGYLGEHMQFDTKRSDLGELVYRLKYKGSSPDVIVETAASFARERWPNMIECVIPPPPSLHRTRQPAVVIAQGIAAQLGVPAYAAAVVKATATEQMKNVPLHERAPLLSAAIQSGTDPIVGARVLLVDDLWETGS